MRAAVRFGGEQASLTGGVIRVSDGIAVRLGHSERTVLEVEGRGRRVRVGVGDARGVSIGVENRGRGSGGRRDARGAAPGVQSKGAAVRERIGNAGLPADAVHRDRADVAVGVFNADGVSVDVVTQQNGDGVSLRTSWLDEKCGSSCSIPKGRSKPHLTQIC